MVIATIAFAAIAGCDLVGGIAGGMSSSYDWTSQVEIPAQYRDLEKKSVAVLVDAPLDIQYDFTSAVPRITELVNLQISQGVNCRILRTRDVLAYQSMNAAWISLDYGAIAESLHVDRIILVDLIEYRLFSPGNSYLWSGQITADVNVYEAESPDPTALAFTEHIVGRFPPIDAVGRDQESAQTIEHGLQLDFTRRVAWLFYDHVRIKGEMEKEKRRR